MQVSFPLVSRSRTHEIINVQQKLLFRGPCRWRLECTYNSTLNVCTYNMHNISLNRAEGTYARDWNVEYNGNLQRILEWEYLVSVENSCEDLIISIRMEREQKANQGQLYPLSILTVCMCYVHKICFLNGRKGIRYMVRISISFLTHFLQSSKRWCGTPRRCIQKGMGLRGGGMTKIC